MLTAVTAIIVCGTIIGGFVTLLIIAMRKEKNKVKNGAANSFDSDG